MTIDNKAKQYRKRTRLKGYDYSSAGAYFLTFCTNGRKPLLSIITCSISNVPTIHLTKYGLCVEKSLNYINDNRNDVHVDNYVIMPNHVHLLVTVACNNVDNGFDSYCDNALVNRALQGHPDLVGCDILGAPICGDGALGNRALQYCAPQNDHMQNHNALNYESRNESALGIIPQFISSIKRYTNKKSQYDLWQSGYNDHIIRDEQDYLIHWKYIDDNPAKWAEDKYYV